MSGPARWFLSCMIVSAISMLGVSVSCSRHGAVVEFFHEHGLTYPVDSSGLGIYGVEYVGVEEDEVTAEGTRDFVQSGIVHIKNYFEKQQAGATVKGAEAIVLEKPVLYRSEKGDVGIMVKVTAYGTGEPEGEVNQRLSFIGPDREMWRVQNFAYFFRNEFYKWQFGGMVY